MLPGRTVIVTLSDRVRTPHLALLSVFSFLTARGVVRGCSCDGPRGLDAFLQVRAKKIVWVMGEVVRRSAVYDVAVSPAHKPGDQNNTPPIAPPTTHPSTSPSKQPKQSASSPEPPPTPKRPDTLAKQPPHPHTTKPSRSSSVNR